MSTTSTFLSPKEGNGRPTLGSAFSGSTLTNISPPEPNSDVRDPLRREFTLDSRLTPATIPPEHKSRTLILCFDGTGDQFDNDNSNIVQLVSLLKKNDSTKQMVYYQAGIGTYTTQEDGLSSKVTKTLDVMFAWNLHAHVTGGYEFLMQNYTDGDRICIFGFSRGAYTARSLAGMIHKVGLLPAGNIQQVPFAYKMYKRADTIGWEQSNAFKEAFSVDVDIEFVGVWDTVDSVGLIPKRLPFTTSNTIVRTFRHAVALDERRAKFKANLWNRPSADEQKLGIQGVCGTAPASPAPSNGGGKPTKRSRKEESEEERKLSEFEDLYSQKLSHKNLNRHTDIEEVWFSGCHCDVGGGSVSNATRHSLARISLRWMVRECFKTNTGIMFDSQRLKAVGLDPTTLYPFVTPRPPPLPVDSMAVQKHIPPSMVERIISSFKVRPTDASTDQASAASSASIAATFKTEEEEELHDAMSPVYDQLRLKRPWWLLEIIPLTLRYQRGDDEWVERVGLNRARPRFIPKQRKNGVKVHRSVKLRMDAEYPASKQKKYKPKAKLNVEPTWVD